MIQLQHINKIFYQGHPNETAALCAIDFSVSEGEIVILKGPSGSGKSTILSLIAALSKPTSGEVIVDGSRISKLPDNFAALFRREHIGFIFQKFNLIPTLTVFDNIIVPLLPTALSKQEIEDKAQTVMQKFSIGHKAHIEVKNLSGGEQQRTAIARALVNDPKIILADEPTANLDEALSKQFLSFIKELKDEKKTVIIATHDPLFFGQTFVSREIMLKNGEIV